MSSVEVTTWNFRRLFNEIICDRATLLNWCRKNGLLPILTICPEGHVMTLQENLDGSQGGLLGRFRCAKKHTSANVITISMAKNTIFQNSKVPAERVMILMYCFTCFDLNQADCIHESSFTSETSTQKISEWYCYCRELITDYLLRHREYNIKLGGQDMVIEVQKWEFGKRKFIGNSASKMWAVGIIEATSNRFHIVKCIDNRQDHQALFQIIEEHVLPGTTVVIRNPEAYRHMSKSYKFTRHVPLHELPDGDSKMNICLQSILPNPRSLKRISGVHCESSYGDYMLEYLWRREMKMSNEDPFECFLRIIRCQYPM